MSDKESIETLQAGWDILIQQAKFIAMLPLEEWLQQFAKAEAIAPFVDPTLYRDYLYSGKGDIIVNIIKAALPLKKAILDAQAKVSKQPTP